MRFHIGDITSITTGKLLSPKRMEGIYNILNYLTGDNLYTHELPNASRFCKPYLLKQYPELSKINGEKINTENHKEFLDNLVKEYGEYLEIESIVKEWNNRNKFNDPVIMEKNGELLLVIPKNNA